MRLVLLSLSLSLSLGLLTTACGGLEDEPLGQRDQPIINGTACDESDHPSAVAIMIDAKAVFAEFGLEIPVRTAMCTGTLIAPDVILAAAHCVEAALLTQGFGDIKDATYYALFDADLSAYADPMAGLPPEFGGTPLQPIPSGAHKVKAWVANPAFTVELLQSFTGGVNDNLNDVALLFLEAPITDVKPAIVITPEEVEQIVKDKEVYVVGWGQQAQATNPFAPPPSGVKFCGPTFINEIGDYEMQIGAGEETTRKCHGDSGGPSYMTVETDFVEKERVVGITSHAYDREDCVKGGVDTRVDAWLDWIDEQMRAACTDGTRSWCDVLGIISPEYYELPPAADAGVVAGDGGDEKKSDGGCTVTGAAANSTGLFVLMLLGLLLVRRRG